MPWYDVSRLPLCEGIIEGVLMDSVGVSEAAAGADGGVSVGELDFVEFVVAVLDFACAVGDEHGGERFVEVVFLGIWAVDDADVARGETLREPTSCRGLSCRCRRISRRVTSGFHRKSVCISSKLHTAL